MQSLTKDVSKKVQHPTDVDSDGKPLKIERTAHLHFDSVIPDSLDDCLALLNQTAESMNAENKDNKDFVTVDAESLIVRAIRFAIWTHVRTRESNNLGKADANAKNLRKAVKNLSKVMVGMSEDAIRTMLLSNPEMRSKMDTNIETETNVVVKPSDLIFPDILAGEEETEETEQEEETETA